MEIFGYPRFAIVEEYLIASSVVLNPGTISL